MKPLARKGEYFSENLPDEVVLYDKNTHELHCLSKPAAAILDYCDGTRTVDDLARLAAGEFGPVWDREVVMLALEDLEKAGLVELSSPAIPDGVLTSRRALIASLAVAGAIMLPFVSTILAPTAQAAGESSVPE